MTSLNIYIFLNTSLYIAIYFDKQQISVFMLVGI